MNRTGLLIALGGVAVAGCAVDGTGSSGGSNAASSNAPVAVEAPASAPAPTRTLLASATAADGHSVAFYEISAGNLVVEESGPKGTMPLDEVDHAASFADAYLAVTGAHTLPDAVSGAMTRFAAAGKTAKTDAPEPPAKEILMNTPGENWFYNQFCLDRSTAYCLFSNSGSESVPWSQAQGYTEIGWDDGTDATSLVMLDYLWENVGGSWQWVNDVRAPPIAPNYWESERFFNAGMVYRYASVAGGSGPGGVAPVGLTSEVRNASFNATWAGQWEFSGTYFMGDTLVNISVTNPLPGESPQSVEASVSGGSFYQLMPVWCASYPGTANINFKAVGMQSGETAYASASENGCW